MIKLYRCGKCGKAFRAKEALDEHGKEHSGKISLKIPSIGRKQLPALAIALLFIVSSIAFIINLFPGDSGTPAGSTRKLGALGSTHEHSDFAIFIDGQKLTPLGPEHFVRSPYVHVESGAGEGSVIHVHATGVTLGFFLSTLGFDLDGSCLTMTQKYCSDGTKALKLYVRNKDSQWEQSFDYGTYVLKDLDKVLISYGPETEEQIRAQQNAITDFASANAGRP